MTTATPSVGLNCSFSSFTATASAQVSQVAACATAVGDIFITGDRFGEIDITGTQMIYGNLRINGTQKVTTFKAPTLILVSGELKISDATILATINLAKLATVGSLYYNALPALQVTGLTSGITSAEKITIANTGLTSLGGIKVHFLKTFDVNNNQDLSSIDSPLQSVTDLLSINYNSHKVAVDLDQLTLVNHISFQSVGSFSARNLSMINGSLSIESNTFSEFSFNALTRIGDSLSINRNDNLKSFNFSALSYVGGALNIIRNKDLTDFSYFGKLSTIGGSVNLVGAFNNGSFPSLTKVAGGFNLTSTGKLSCIAFAKLNSNGGVKGDQFYCQGASSTVSSSSSKAVNQTGDSKGTGAASGGSSSSRKSDGSIVKIGVPAIAALFACAGAFVC